MKKRITGNLDKTLEVVFRVVAELVVRNGKILNICGRQYQKSFLTKWIG